MAAAAIALAVMALAVGAAAVMAAAETTRRWRHWMGACEWVGCGRAGWAVVELVEGRVAESVDKRVVWRDGGGGVSDGSVWRGIGGSGGGALLAALAAEKTTVVKAAAALRWRALAAAA